MSSLSRVLRYGTIFTRTRDLMRAGVMKEEDRPLWYDTMKYFPPIEPPTYDRQIPDGPIREILYPEDVVRAKFYKTYGTVNIMDLGDHMAVQSSPCYRFIAKYQELEKTWTGSEDDLFEATAAALSEQGLQLKKRGAGKRPERTRHEESQKPGEDTAAISKEDMADILKSALSSTDPKQQET